MVNPAITSFEQCLTGTFFSLLSWQQLEDFWKRVDPAAGWYLYAIGEGVPSKPASADEVSRFVIEIDALLRREHDEDYCGIVYADHLDCPHLVKIYDPHHLGVSCGSSGEKILPGWVMSLTPPSDLGRPKVIPGSRRRWWQALRSSS